MTKPKAIIVTLRGSTDDRDRVREDARSVGLSVNQYVRYMLRLDDPNADETADGTADYWKLRRQILAARAANRSAVDVANLAAGELQDAELRAGAIAVHLRYVREYLARFRDQFGEAREAAEPPAEPDKPAAVGRSDAYARFRVAALDILGPLSIVAAADVVARVSGRSVHVEPDPTALAAFQDATSAAFAEVNRRGYSYAAAMSDVRDWLDELADELRAAAASPAATYLEWKAGS